MRFPGPGRLSRRGGLGNTPRLPGVEALGAALFWQGRECDGLRRRELSVGQRPSDGVSVEHGGQPLSLNASGTCGCGRARRARRPAPRRRCCRPSRSLRPRPSQSRDGDRSLAGLEPVPAGRGPDVDTDVRLDCGGLRARLPAGRGPGRGGPSRPFTPPVGRESSTERSSRGTIAGGGRCGSPGRGLRGRARPGHG